MNSPSVPANEATRLEALHSLNILDTPPEERFDRLTRLAKRLFGVPIALVSLVDADHQWFKSCAGLSVTETSREISFCAHAILGDDVFMIPDTLGDPRFHDNPLVTDAPNIRFYAGCPLRVKNGSKLGTLCLLDINPRTLSEDDLALLRDLARMAEQELDCLHLATTDDLTLLPNRRGFEALGQRALNFCKRAHKPATLLFFDLNNFKTINDTFGHAEGDRALSKFADLLRSALRETDVIGRLGGDEFVAVLANSDLADASTITQRLRASLDTLNRETGSEYDLHFSVGKVEYAPDSHASIGSLLAAADAAMYSNKSKVKGEGAVLTRVAAELAKHQ